MDILSYSGGAQDGGSHDNGLRRDAEVSFNFGSPAATPTSASQGPSTSSEPGGASMTSPNEEIFFGDFLSNWPIQLRLLSSLESKNYFISWRMNNHNGIDNVDINWIAWVARSSMISNETDQVIVDKMMINSNISAANSERGFMSDDSNGREGVTIHYTILLNKLQSGKDTSQVPDGVGQAGGLRQASDTDFMRFQISWTKRSTQENKISNSGVFFIKLPKTPYYNRAWVSNVTGYDENVGTSVGPATSITRTSSMPASSSTSDSNGEATHAAASNRREVSTGAMAGIVIGSFIAVILVAGLVWFFMRRRRNQREPQFDPQHKTAPFMEDKALAAAQVVDSGRSEDSGRQDYTSHNTNNSPVAIAYGEQDQQPHTHTGSFTNLRHDTGTSNGPSNYPGHNPEHIAIAVTCDAQQHQHGADTDSGREDPTHAHITLPIPPRIRHLVEPHHTDDDLRRLLAEEDHLDEEIARGS